MAPKSKDSPAAEKAGASPARLDNEFSDTLQQLMGGMQELQKSLAQQQEQQTLFQQEVERRFTAAAPLQSVPPQQAAAAVLPGAPDPQLALAPAPAPEAADGEPLVQDLPPAQQAAPPPAAEIGDADAEGGADGDEEQQARELLEQLDELHADGDKTVSEQFKHPLLADERCAPTRAAAAPAAPSAAVPPFGRPSYHACALPVLQRAPIACHPPARPGC